MIIYFRSYAIAMSRSLRADWRYTYRSARREWPRWTAARKLGREVWKGLLVLPVYAREIRSVQHRV